VGGGPKSHDRKKAWSSIIHSIRSALKRFKRFFNQILYSDWCDLSVTGYSVISINFMLEGIHAREWISPATVTYILDQLVENAETHRSAQLSTFYLTY
jgi:hypothetical protein